MQQDPRVHVRLDDVVEQFVATGDAIVAVVVPDGAHSPSVIQLVEEAANAAMTSFERIDLAGQQLARIVPYESTVGLIVEAPLVWEEEELRAWLATFARHLEGAGVSADVRAAPLDWLPDQVVDPAARWMTAYVGYTCDEKTIAPCNQWSWSVDEDLTRTITDAAVEWVQRLGAGDSYVRAGSTQHHTAIADGSPLSATLRGVPSANLTRVSFGYASVRSASFACCGEATYQTFSADVGAADAVAELIDVLRPRAAALDIAFVRKSSGTAGSWILLAGASPALPFCRESDLRYGRDLRSTFVPDAHAVQILTDAHVAKMTDTTAWDITRLPNGRHLVCARDIEAWFQPDEPDPNVLAAARRDFGPALLRHEFAEARRLSRLGWGPSTSDT